MTLFWLVVHALLVALVHSGSIECNETLSCTGNVETTFTEAHDNVLSSAYQGLYGLDAPNTSLTVNTDNMTYIGQGVVCYGASSCASLSALTYNSEESAASPQMMCSGSSACFGISDMHVSYGAMVNCTGSSSCAYSRFAEYTQLPRYISTLTCSGDRSCAYAEVGSADAVLATGSFSFANATIDNFRTISFLGYHAADNATVYCRRDVRFDEL